MLLYGYIQNALLCILEMISHHKKMGAKRVDPVKHPKHFINSRVAKTFFDSMIYFGTIKSYENGFWNIEYDDGAFDL